MVHRLHGLRTDGRDRLVGSNPYIAIQVLGYRVYVIIAQSVHGRNGADISLSLPHHTPYGSRAGTACPYAAVACAQQACYIIGRQPVADAYMPEGSVGYGGCAYIGYVDAVVRCHPQIAVFVGCQGIDAAFRYAARQQVSQLTLPVFTVGCHYQSLLPCGYPCTPLLIGKAVCVAVRRGCYRSGVERAVSVQHIAAVTFRRHQYITVRPPSQPGYEICLLTLMQWVGHYDTIVSQRITPQHGHTGILLSYPYVAIPVLMYVGKVVGIEYGVVILCREVLHAVVSGVIYIQSVAVGCDVESAIITYDGRVVSLFLDVNVILTQQLHSSHLAVLHEEPEGTQPVRHAQVAVKVVKHNAVVHLQIRRHGELHSATVH